MALYSSETGNPPLHYFGLDLKEMMLVSTSKIFIVGVGPGDKELITQKANSIIQSAHYVAGFRSALEVVGHLIHGQTITLDYHNQETMVEKIVSLSRQGYTCAVCVYGDPNLSDKQFIDRIRTNEADVEIVPGISSVQATCARLRLPLENTILITFHKRGSIEEEKEELLELAKFGKRHLVVLPRPWDFMPPDIARFLLQERVEPDRPVTTIQKVTLQGEEIDTCTLGELAEKKLQQTFSDLTIVVIGPKNVQE